jgi:hypothetical protein
MPAPVQRRRREERQCAEDIQGAAEYRSARIQDASLSEEQRENVAPEPRAA